MIALSEETKQQLRASGWSEEKIAQAAARREARRALPQLIDRRQLAAELGIKLASAETIMKHVPKVKLGSRVFVDAADVARYLKSEAKT